MQLNTRSPVPLYQQFKALMEQKIASGEWAVDELIPTELSLMKVYGISRTTVRQAMDELVAEGRIYRQRGRGTFVAPPKIAQTLGHLTGFAEELALRGLDTQISLLTHAFIPASAPVAAALDLQPGAEVLHICRLVRTGGIPVFLDDSYFLPSLVPVLLPEAIATRPLYQVLEAAGRTPAEGEQTLRAINLPDDVATALGVRSGAAGLAIARITKDRLGQPMEYTTAFYRGDRYEYAIRLFRRQEPSV